MKRSHCIAALAALAAAVQAGPGYAQSDFYIRSQHSNGSFTGSHEILTAPRTGYHKASYCDRTFWVTTTTVAWTEEEVTAGRTLILEENVGTSRTIVCTDNKAFASLDDLGLKQREIEALRDVDGTRKTRASRLHNIRDAFKQFK